jgi:dTDP-4-amino-4,6-dideoxygalactose transaminase
LFRRHVAQLGGTTTLSDCLAAFCCLAQPWEWIRGPAIARYENEFARCVGSQYAISFAAGRVGLYGTLRALGVGPEDEVLLQVPTHIVVPNAIRYTGAKPVYVDCHLDTYNMDLAEAAHRITPRTKALVLQHTFGIPAELDQAIEFADRHGLHLIEDCVHSLGATYKGRQVGTFGKAAFFSTEETKTISSTMGGMVVTNDPQLAKKIETFRETCVWPGRWLTIRYIAKFALYFISTKPQVHRYARAAYEFLGRRQPLPVPTSGEELRGLRPPAYEKRLSNAQAILALRQLARLNDNLHHRRATARAYRDLLTALGFAVPPQSANADPAYVRYPIMVHDRDAALKAAAPHAVLGTWFTSVLEEALSPEHGDYIPGSCPRAELAARHLVNLPTHQRVCASDIEAICAALAAYILPTPVCDQAVVAA